MARIIYGGNHPLVQCTNHVKDRWLVLWNEGEGKDGGLSYMSDTFDHKPTLQEIKDVINDYINDKVNEEIYSGLVVDNNIVYLSLENQINYKSAYDLAYQTSGKNLPQTFKFGEDYYKVFNTLEELEEFYLKVRNHIDSCLDKGWRAKTSVDYSKYEELLN